MRKTIAIINLTTVALGHAKGATPNVRGSADSFVDELCSRTLDLSAHHSGTGLDGTLESKAAGSHVASPASLRFSPLATSRAEHALVHGRGVIAPNAHSHASQRTSTALYAVAALYKAGEIPVGKQSSRPEPFNPSMVGTYSFGGRVAWKPKTPRVDKINQDRGFVVFPFAGNPEQALFTVFDGHGDKGEKVAELAMTGIKDALENNPSLVGDEASALEEAFVSADCNLGANSRAKGRTSNFDYGGTTAVAALLRGNKVWVANAGDSRCVLAYRRPTGEIQTKDLTKDQKPDSPGEKERIEYHGGFISPPGYHGDSARVWLDTEMTDFGLALSRSIGDHAAKKYGVIASPEVEAFDLSGDDLFMILATDGIWDHLSSEEAADIVWNILQSGGGARQATQALIESAASRWNEIDKDYCDDITAIVVALPCFE